MLTKRVRLKVDFFPYKKGQTGIVYMMNNSNSYEFVVWDGYEKEKQEAEEFKKKYGESLNEVIFAAEIHKTLLESC